MVAMVIKSIKYNKSKQNEYNRILSDKAKEFINQKILSSSWYPYKLHKEVYNALCLVEARNNPTILNQWGRDQADRLMSTIYKISPFRKDIQKAVERYSRFHRMVYNFGEIDIELISDTKIIFSYKDFDPNWENFYHTAKGYVQRFFELSIDKKINFKFLKKSWEEKGWTKVMLSWAP